ncbi:sensor domain-containing diguanylate cyclase [bacterium]|nr:sensor domain-containing diguanylate cyclase [bacterium]
MAKGFLVSEPKDERDILLNTFSEITSLISLGKDRSIIFNKIINSAMKILPAKKVFLIFHEENRIKKYKVEKKDGGQRVDVVDIPDSSGIFNWLRREVMSQQIKGGGVFSLDLSLLADECWDEQEISGAVISVPIMSKRSVFGVILALNDSRKQLFSERDIYFLDTLANQAAIAFENYLLYKKLRHESITDGLTGVYNYRFLLRSLRVEIKRTARFEGVFSFLMLDVDNLKEYNDENGHLYGSKALKIIAGLIKNECREIDIIAKYGGDEFSVILPHTNLQGAKSLSRRILKAVHDYKFKGKTPGALTCSIGVSIFPNDSRSLEEIISNADKALYYAKAQGKNGIKTYTELNNKLEIF